jgi:hypothetical protein
VISHDVCPAGVHYRIEWRRVQKCDTCVAAAFNDHPMRCMELIAAPTGFHADEHGGQGYDKRYEVRSRQALAPDALALLIHPDNGKNPLCDVDSEYS